MAVHSGPNTIEDGLVLALDAGNTKSYPGSGTTWTNIGASGNNGTLTNGPGFTSLNGGAITFDGTDDFIVMSSNIFNSSLTNFSISVWYYSNTSTGGILLGNHRHNLTWESIWTSTTDFIVNAANNNTTNRQTLSFTPANFNIWNNLTFINSSTSGYMKVFLNGSERATKSATVVPWSSSVVNTIGAQLNSAGAPVGLFNGRISNVSVYNKALTAAEVKQNFEALRGRYNV